MICCHGVGHMLIKGITQFLSLQQMMTSASLKMLRESLPKVQEIKQKILEIRQILENNEKNDAGI
jgi:hypothetical protein